MSGYPLLLFTFCLFLILVLILYILRHVKSENLTEKLVKHLHTDFDCFYLQRKIIIAFIL